MRRKSWLRSLVHDEKGAVTIEFTTIFPFAILLIVMFTDASVLYLTRTEMFRVSREAARLVSVGAITADQVPAFMNSEIMLGARTYTAAVYSGSVVIIEMSVNVGDASIFGFFRPVLGHTMKMRIEMLREPTPSAPPSGGELV